MPGKYYITTAIDYVNSAPHIGTAYEKVSADAFARFHRLVGDDVYFQMGNDEHSLNVVRAAKAKGMDPKAYCDEMEGVFRRIWDKLEVSFDYFIRTTDEAHEIGVRKLFEAMADDLYQGHYEGYYCDSCEAFYREKDLEDGCCPTHGVKPSWIAEENYFFRLSKYADRLLEHIEANPGFIEPEARRNEIVQLIRGGLEDISATRASRDWGVPFPMDESEVIYIWFDALTNYVTGVGYGGDEERFRKWWPADVHIIGKDVTRFHCVIWPAMLMSAGVTLPKKIYGHGFVYFKGQRLSKSRGVIVDPLEAADVFGPCALRYFLMREGTYGRDMDFTWERFRSRYDSELANDLGNLVSRATAMVVKFVDGTLKRPSPETGDPAGPAGAVAGGDLAALAGTVREGVVADMEAYAPQAALSKIWELVRRANAYIEEEKPWVLAREDRVRLESVLWATLESIRQIAVMVWPVMPGKSEEILAAIGYAWRPGEAPLGDVLVWGAGWPDEVEIEKAAAVFPKYTDEELESRFDAAGTAGGEPPGLTAGPATVGTESESEMISFDEFKKLDLRLGRVLDASRVQGTDKLITLSVDLGDGDERPMVAGIAERYEPEALIGKTIVVVANLEPTTIRGVESRAMLLAATGGDEIALVVPDKDLPPGTKVS